MISPVKIENLKIVFNWMNLRVFLIFFSMTIQQFKFSPYVDLSNNNNKKKQNVNKNSKIVKNFFFLFF